MIDRRLLVLTMALIGSVAYAADWQPVGSNAAGRFQMDVASVVRDGLIVRAQVRFVFAEPMRAQGGQSVWGMLQYMYFNCDTRQSATKQYSAITDSTLESSTVVGDLPDDQMKWRDVEGYPGDSLLLTTACARMPPK